MATKAQSNMNNFFGDFVEEKAFRQDVHDFNSMLEMSMGKQVHDMSQKYAFDFSND